MIAPRQTYVEARGMSRDSIYARDEWEVCAGSEGLPYMDCKEMVGEWKRGEMEDYGLHVTAYRYINEVGASRSL